MLPETLTSAAYVLHQFCALVTAHEAREATMQAAARSAFLLPLLLALPFTAVGVERTGSGADLVAVEYEGTITEVFEAPAQYVVGDRIKGRLLVDRRLAQLRSDSSPNQATYTSSSPDFVTGFWRRGGDGFDRVSLGKNLSVVGADKPFDSFSVEDWLVIPNASLDSASVFGVSARLHDFLDGTSLDQSFELTSADVDEPNEDLSGGFRFSSIGPFAFVSFVLDKLTVKPGRCLAP